MAEALGRSLAISAGRWRTGAPAVGDDGPDRFAMFLGERKPDERYIVRFPQNVDGDYEAYGHPVWMYGPYPVRGVYTQPMRAIPATGKPVTSSGMNRKN